MLKENIKELRKRKGYSQEQLALRLNVVLQHQQTEKMKKAIVNAIIVGAFVLFLGAIYEDWCQMFYEFGQNLYHWLNK